MSVRIYTVDVGDVKDRFLANNYKWTLEEGCENYIKKEVCL